MLPWAVRFRGIPVRSQPTFGKPHRATARAGGCSGSPRIGGLRYANLLYVTAWQFGLTHEVGGDDSVDHRQRWCQQCAVYGKQAAQWDGE